jgi:uncharacterized protein
MKYINRKLEFILRKYLKIFPVIGLTGPRQSGKSTMLKKILSGKYRYVTFDNIMNRDFFHRDPEGFMETYSGNVIFDEIQYVPEIFNYIKIIVDNNRSKKGQYILTGSSQFSYLKKVSESLAGRIGLLTLLPFQYSEIPDKYKDISLFNGSYPELSDLKYRNLDYWYSSYISTYLERDVRALSNIGDLRDFSSFIKLLASRVAQLLNLTEISRELGVAVNTVKKWVSILEASYIIFLLPPYYHNIGKRIIKSPKIYFYDTGIVSYLTGINDLASFERSPLKGNIFENYIISELIKTELHLKTNTGYYFIRTSNGEEIDFVVIKNGIPHYYEIKSSYTFKLSMLKGIESLIGEKEIGSIIYRGKDLKIKNKYTIYNYKTLLS